MKKYNRDLNKKTADFPDGGLPVYADDLQQIESNSNISNVYSILKGYSVILSGCLVTNINTITKKCDVSTGLVLIDDIVYIVDALINQTYPFSIQNGDTEDDVRGFEDNNFYTVATTYNYSIRTNFVFNDILDIYPSNLSTKEIYFDPFTSQRSEYVLNNLSKRKGECFLKNNTIGNITKDEAGNFITGTDISWNLGNDILKYAYYGYKVIENNGGSLNLSSTIGSLTGSDNKLLSETNLPPHQHDVNGYTNYEGLHQHEFENNLGATIYGTNLGLNTQQVTINKNGLNQTQLVQYWNQGTAVGPRTAVSITDRTDLVDAHRHQLVSCITNTGNKYKDSAFVQSELNVQGKIYGVALMEFVGYPSTFSIANPSSSNGYQIIGYKFWDDVKYMNM